MLKSLIAAAAQVCFIDKDGGYYLKTAAKGTLKRDAELTRFFHSKQLSAEVLAYESGEKDFLLTSCIPGENCSFAMYLDEPIRLCDTTAELLRALHSTNITSCPVQYLDSLCGKYPPMADRPIP